MRGSICELSSPKNTVITATYRIPVALCVLGIFNVCQVRPASRRVPGCRPANGSPAESTTASRAVPPLATPRQTKPQSPARITRTRRCKSPAAERSQLHARIVQIPMSQEHGRDDGSQKSPLWRRPAPCRWVWASAKIRKATAWRHQSNACARLRALVQPDDGADVSRTAVCHARPNTNAERVTGFSTGHMRQPANVASPMATHRVDSKVASRHQLGEVPVMAAARPNVNRNMNCTKDVPQHVWRAFASARCRPDSTASSL